MQKILAEIKQIGTCYIHYESKLQSTKSFLRKKGEQLSEKYVKPLEDEIAFYEYKLNELAALAADAYQELPLWTEWHYYVKGTSPICLLKLLALIDFNKVSHPSSIWMYAGIVDPKPLPEKIYDPTLGKEVPLKDPVTGRLIRYNRTVKSTLFLQALSFIGHPPNLWRWMVNKPPRFNGGYARLYTKFRAATDQKHPDWTATRRYYDALRKVMKVYTAHLYIVYSWFEYKIAEVHYAVAKLHHNYIYMPVFDAPEKPEWWWKLREEYIRAKVKPIEA
jgi:hypothetical protein